MYSKQQAIDTMNNWGREKIPFLFIIDFEMKAILLHRTDVSMPEDISFSLPILLNSAHKDTKPNTPFIFKKIPISYGVYQKAFAETISNIKAGNSFLLNLTFPTQIETDLTLPQIFQRSTAKYKLLYKNEFVVFSPETFVTIKDGFIFSYPMKGTISAAEEDAYRRILENPKEEAEHFTIVDLIRNDLSMVATDIEVKRFRYIDRITTNRGDILQVSSEISGKLPANYVSTLGSIIFSLLPAGSVTGAPKDKTLAIIKKVENAERGYYTGVFGYFDGNSLDSAVMIRFIENRNDGFYFRSGGGITFQSNLADEYNELIEKVYVPFA